MSWINLPSVSISNGSNVLTINGGTSTANVKVGDGIQIGAFELYEVAGVYATQLTLSKNWGNATQTSAEAVVVPTFGDFNSATEAMRSATTVTQGNFAEMESWWTETGSVSFKGYDGETHTVRSAKQMDADVQATQDDLTANIEASMVDKVAEVSPANIDWDVDIPFNEGLELARGFGNRDAYGNRAVDFSRASSTENINKTGNVETLATDAVAVTDNGVACFSSVTTCSQIDSSLNDRTAVQYGTNTVTSELAPDGEGYWNFLTPDGSSWAYLDAVNATSTDGTYITSSVFVKKGTGSIVLTHYWRASVNDGSGTSYFFDSDDPDSSTVVGSDAINATYVDYGNYYRIYLTTRYLDANSATTGYISRMRTLNVTDDSAYVWGYNVTPTSTLVPYIKTVDSAVTRASDIFSVPLEGNLPPAGKPFSIMVDAAIPFAYNIEPYVFGLSRATTGSDSMAMMFRRTPSSNLVQFYFDDADDADRQISVSNIDDKRHRFVCVYDGGSTTKLFVDGVLKGSNAAHGAKTYKDFALINIGSWYLGAASFLNADLKNFRILHRALSDDEIAALGAAQ